MSAVCLINPPTTDPHEMRPYFPLALLALGGVLKKNNVSTQLWDFDFFFKYRKNMTKKQFLELLFHGVRGSRAKVFCISSICSNFPMAVYLAQEIKRIKPESLILLGGPQPSSVPVPIVERFSFVDAVAVGEGELILQDLIDRDFSKDKLDQIPGLVFFRQGKVVEVPKRKLVENLDDLPVPDYSLLDPLQYQKHTGGKFFMSPEVGRGCPFHCTFCSTSVMWERKFRVKSPQRIYSEMQALHKAYGFTAFEFVHDNFTTSRKFVNDFCDFMESHNEENFHWYSSSRTDCISGPLMQRMYNAGCRSLFFGIESGSERMQQIIQKNLNFSNFEPVLEYGNSLGIQSVAAFIMGFPEETFLDMDQTVLRALRYKQLGTANVFLAKLSPLTGTAVYRGYSDQLRELALSSTLSPQNYGLLEVEALILSHPDLFSSFYHVPHPLFSSMGLTCFVEFSHHLINGNIPLAVKLLGMKKNSTTKLFSFWDDWAKEQGIRYWDYRVYSQERFNRDFNRFGEDLGVCNSSEFLFPTHAPAPTELVSVSSLPMN